MTSAEASHGPGKVRWTALSLWLVVGCIAALSCSLIRPAAHIGNEYFPVGNDGFYHAVRILEAARDPAAFYEFDPKIHAPEGSLLVWPWGYDYVMAKLVRAGLAIAPHADPLMILLWIPVGAVFIGIGLLMLVARRLSLSDWPVALAGLCMALNQTTQVLYGFGEIDHHYAEHIFILASLAAGLSWFQAPTVRSGVALGAIFGVAIAVHNALFILQAPFLAAALAHWLQGKELPTRPVIAFAITLLVAALAVLIPSLPFREGLFEFYTLSWFHLYIACCTALVALLLARLRRSPRNIAALAASAIILLMPLVEQIKYAQSFVSGSLGMLADVMEMRSPISFVLEGDLTMISGLYSLLLWLAPVTFALCVFRLWRERDSPRLLFWIFCVLGLALLSTQLRMHYFGGFALYLPWLIVAQEYALKRQELRKRTFLMVSLTLVLAYVPVIRHALVAPVPHAADSWFNNLYPVFGTLRKACAEDPGIVLADSNAGHYIRYFTACSVIANNFLLTEQQFRKVDEVTRLFSLPPGELTKQAPFVKYVLARAGDVQPKEGDHYSYTFFRDASRMPEALLLQPADAVPPEFKLLFEVTIAVQRERERVQNIPYAKLYKIVPGDAAAPLASADASSVNDVSE